MDEKKKEKAQVPVTEGDRQGGLVGYIAESMTPTSPLDPMHPLGLGPDTEKVFRAMLAPLSDAQLQSMALGWAWSLGIMRSEMDKRGLKSILPEVPK